MGWHLTDDLDDYARIVGPILEQDPAENIVATTLLHTLATGHRFSDDPMVFGWHEHFPGDGRLVTGVVCMTPPHPLLLAVVPEGTEAELVSALHGGRAAVTGVVGVPERVEPFSALWAAATSTTSTIAMRQRLYSLDRLIRPEVPGTARRAGADDTDLIVEWFEAFCAENDLPEPSLRPDVVSRIADLGVWIWHDREGTPVSFAGRRPIVAGVARVGPVYTPPEHRRRGYGAGVTAACTQGVLDLGANQVVLFTDLANPTSNVIYQQIGYRALSDRLSVRFGT